MACHSVELFGVARGERTKAVGKRILRTEAAHFKGLLESSGFFPQSTTERRVVNFDGESLGVFAKKRDGIRLEFEMLDINAQGRQALEFIYLTSMVEANSSINMIGVLRAFPERAHFSLPNISSPSLAYFTYCAFLVPISDINQAWGSGELLLDALKNPRIRDALKTSAQIGYPSAISTINQTIRAINEVKARNPVYTCEGADEFIASLERKIGAIQSEAEQNIEIIRSDPKLAAAMRFVAMKDAPA